jgi:tetratricopeptide (TPR) repeat protein
MRPWLVLMASAALLFPIATASHAQLHDGDLAWALRAETLDDQRSQPDRIEEAIRRYRTARQAAPRSLEANWKLLRALHYAIDFTNLGAPVKDAFVQEATEIASASTRDLDTPGATEGDRARLLFWSAIAWGTRAQRVGLLTIVREGVASRMHNCAGQSLALDASVDQGGALRLLSRLHATLPRVPFVSGWVDREQALPLAERAHRLDPSHPGNRLILALALLEQAPDRNDEARELIANVANSEPRPDFLVEDLAIREQARKQLEESP